MRVAEWIAPEQLRLAERPLPEPESGQAVVRVVNCGICGSDLHSYHSGFAARPGQVLGHEFSGVITAAPGVANLAVGDRVTVRPLIPCGACEACVRGDVHLCPDGHPMNIGYGSPGAFAEQVLVPRAVVGETVFPLPPAIDDRAGALIEPLAVSLHAVNLADIKSSDVVLVLGAGAIGLGVTAFAHRAGATTIVAEPSALRRDSARAMGADVLVDPIQDDTVTAVREITGTGSFGLGARADVVIDCAGAPRAFADGLKSVRQGGTMVLAAIYSGPVEMKPDRIVEKELKLQGSIAYRDEFGEVISLLRDGQIDAASLISHTFPLERIDEAFQVQRDAARSLKVLVTPASPEF